MKNFYLYLDREGKMPVIKARKCQLPSHPYYIRYVGDKPIAYYGPLEVIATRSPRSGELNFYDYSQQEFVAAATIVQKEN